MKAIMREVSIELKVPIITCPICGISFSVHFYDQSDSKDLLVDQVPDSGGPFYCPYCGGNLNENI